MEDLNRTPRDGYAPAESRAHIELAAHCGDNWSRSQGGAARGSRAAGAGAGAATPPRDWFGSFFIFSLYSDGVSLLSFEFIVIAILKTLWT